MRATIAYFSETGNTEKAAYAIAETLGAEGFDVTPLLFEDVDDFPEALDGIDILGVGFPTFYGYPPKMIMDMIDSLPQVNDVSAFVFTTYGGMTAGDSLYDAAKGLVKKGYRILGGLKIEGADSFPQGAALKINNGRPDERDLKMVSEFATLMLNAHKEGKSLDVEQLASNNPLFVKNRGKPRKGVLSRLRKPVEGEIEFNKEQCLFCVTCKKSCPTRSIGEGEKFPEFNWKCIDGLKCFQCARVCPGKALTVKYPGTLEEYAKYREKTGDSKEEKSRVYTIA